MCRNWAARGATLPQSSTVDVFRALFRSSSNQQPPAPTVICLSASTSEEGGTSFGFCSAICRFVASTPTAPVVIPNCDDGVQSTWRSDEANSFPETNVIESSLTAAPKLLAGGNDGGWFSVLMQAAKHTEFLNTVLPNLFNEWHKTEFNCKTWLKSICNEDNFL